MQMLRLITFATVLIALSIIGCGGGDNPVDSGPAKVLKRNAPTVILPEGELAAELGLYLATAEGDSEDHLGMIAADISVQAKDIKGGVRLSVAYDGDEPFDKTWFHVGFDAERAHPVGMQVGSDLGAEGVGYLSIFPDLGMSERPLALTMLPGFDPPVGDFHLLDVYIEKGALADVREVSATVAPAPTGISIREADGGIYLEWKQFLYGDYNVDGTVNGMDLFSIAPIFLFTSDNPDFKHEVDGIADGVINGQDVFPIASNFLASLDGYNVYKGDSMSGPWTKAEGFTPTEAYKKKGEYAEWPVMLDWYDEEGSPPAYYVLRSYDSVSNPQESADSSVVFISDQHCQTVGAAGGTVSLPGKIEITIPAGALATDVEICVSEMSDSGLELAGGLGNLVGHSFNIQPALSLNQKATVRIYYDPGDIPGSPSDLVLSRFDDAILGQYDYNILPALPGTVVSSDPYYVERDDFFVCGQTWSVGSFADRPREIAAWKDDFVVERGGMPRFRVTKHEVMGQTPQEDFDAVLTAALETAWDDWGAGFGLPDAAYPLEVIIGALPEDTPGAAGSCMYLNPEVLVDDVNSENNLNSWAVRTFAQAALYARLNEVGRAQRHSGLAWIYEGVADWFADETFDEVQNFYDNDSYLTLRALGGNPSAFEYRANHAARGFINFAKWAVDQGGGFDPLTLYADAGAASYAGGISTGQSFDAVASTHSMLDFAYSEFVEDFLYLKTYEHGADVDLDEIKPGDIWGPSHQGQSYEIRDGRQEVYPTVLLRSEGTPTSPQNPGTITLQPLDHHTGTALEFRRESIDGELFFRVYPMSESTIRPLDEVRLLVYGERTTANPPSDPETEVDLLFDQYLTESGGLFHFPIANYPVSGDVYENIVVILGNDAMNMAGNRRKPMVDYWLDISGFSFTGIDDYDEFIIGDQYDVAFQADDHTLSDLFELSMDTIKRGISVTSTDLHDLTENLDGVEGFIRITAAGVSGSSTSLGISDQFGSEHQIPITLRWVCRAQVDKAAGGPLNAATVVPFASVIDTDLVRMEGYMPDWIGQTDSTGAWSSDQVAEGRGQWWFLVFKDGYRVDFDTRDSDFIQHNSYGYAPRYVHEMELDSLAVHVTNYVSGTEFQLPAAGLERDIYVMQRADTFDSYLVVEIEEDAGDYKLVFKNFNTGDPVSVTDLLVITSSYGADTSEPDLMVY